jgi:hypothetical protein
MKKNTNILIIDSLNDMDNADSKVSVHNRTTDLMAKHYGCDCVGSKEYDFHVRKIIGKEYGVIIFNYGSGYADFNFLVDFCLKQKGADFYLMQNDYLLNENRVLQILANDHGIKYSVISNHFTRNDKSLFRYYLGKHFDRYVVVNINSIIYEGKIKDNRPSGFFSNYQKENKIPIIYYGMYRDGRVKYFRKYFDKNFHVSTSVKKQRYYTDAGVECIFVPPIKWAGQTNRLFDCKSSLYLEDEFTHDVYAFFGNRFYEAVMYNIPMFFDKSCMNTIEKSGYPIDRYFIVDSKKELMGKVNELGDDEGYSDEFHSLVESERIDVLNKIKKFIGV